MENAGNFFFRIADLFSDQVATSRISHVCWLMRIQRPPYECVSHRSRIKWLTWSFAVSGGLTRLLIGFREIWLCLYQARWTG